MEDYLPIIYLSLLLIFLSTVAIILFRQIIKARRIESRVFQLENKLKKEDGAAKEYYELASLYLDKKLFFQAIQLLQKAIKKAENEKVEPENMALIYNALGFAYFAQEQYDMAIRNYKEALKLFPAYTIAINNLANAYEKKQMTKLALETYKKCLEYDPKNPVALKKIESLEKRLVAS
ncbi:MAG: tetratricopeptide repeat protein [Geminocystis sp.]|nr:tetratricopeptide repeat protein [Geminocystis sp.]MCS7147547.1 tetratricopeptide repeat protein [Geminocystis sp.]MDW8115240.1 tetratricopeptide repeat protein [Geminocystis sp.]MDW8464510.1 tetratricopeptide repeat protein [Geminocystis sp.]HIK38500.1 tetratricopeptide repeat protein [Geminocystis sp. M7585_C2015_104]